MWHYNVKQLANCSWICKTLSLNFGASDLGAARYFSVVIKRTMSNYIHRLVKFIMTKLLGGIILKTQLAPLIPVTRNTRLLRVLIKCVTSAGSRD